MISPDVTAPRARVRLPGLPKRKVIRVATGCADAAQFAAAFYRFCAPDGCFVPTTTMRPAGLEAVFALQLADGRPLLRGVAVVVAAWADDRSPHGRPGVQLRFRRLTADSRALVNALVARRGTARAAVVEPADSPLRTIAMPALAGDGVVAAVEVSDQTERCAPAFADCALDEPPRSAIATILGVAPLPRPTLAQVARAGDRDDDHDDLVPAVHAWIPRELWIAALVFVAAFLIVLSVR